MIQERMEELKHVCRVCNKRYPSGKSLGGHMRSHVIANSYASSSPLHKIKKPNKKALIAIRSDVVAVGDSSNNGYGLRENPRKTWRVVDENDDDDHDHDHTPTLTDSQEKVCKQCGKAFMSMKALCGHMSSHSSRERSFSRSKSKDDEEEEEEEEEEGDDDEDDEDSWASEEEDEEEGNCKEVAMESHSDSVMEAEQSKKARYRAIAVIDSYSPVNGCSSNNSGIEHEQEEVALCLMMLSRDSAAHKAGFNFSAESSENNSVILEGGSSSTYAAKRKNLSSAFDIDNIGDGADGSGKTNPVARKKVKCLELDNSDSGYFENGAKELESDDSVDVYDSKDRVALAEDGDEEVKYAQLKKFLQNRGDKKAKNDDLSATRSPPRSCQKAGKYECSICERTFKTHQALGGHILTHRRGSKNARSGKISAARSANGNDEDQKALMGSKKTKGHCCPYCPKVFKSGQALGGHKRSHMMGCSSRDKASPIKFVDESPPENHRQLLDLNLPAPVEDSIGVMPW